MLRDWNEGEQHLLTMADGIEPGGTRADHGKRRPVTAPQGEANGCATGLRNIEGEGSGETILVVEDNDLLRNLTVRLLSRFGYSVREAASTDEALARLDGVHLLLTDLLLPGGLTGSELAGEARCRNEELGVLITTGQLPATPLDQRSGYPMLYKPYTIQQLLQAVRNALDMRPMRRDDEAAFRLQLQARPIP